ncbi:MAG: N-acetylmuramoyl-L-alanine amidase, partial [Verrucomicrobiota bacterium]
MTSATPVRPYRILWASLLFCLPGFLWGQTKIYIDPGHGGTDSGAVNSSFGTKEADRVLYTGLELRRFLEEDSADSQGGGEWRVRMSRSTDTFISLGGRSADANAWGADRFLSLHQNAFNRSANGTETFSISNAGTSASLRNFVQAEAVAAWDLVNRGNKTASFSVLRNTSMPAALTEMGFIDSPTDHPFCSSDAKCQKYAKHMMFALQKHYGLDPYSPGGVDTPPGILVDFSGLGYEESGSWNSSSSSGFWDNEARWAAVGNQSTNHTVTYQPQLAESGMYEVYAWWVPGQNRSSGTSYTVHTRDGSVPLAQNQQGGGNQWNLLGTFPFEAGNEGKVVLSSALSSRTGSLPRATVVSADALRFLRVADLPPPPEPDDVEITIDNTDPGFRPGSGEWFTGAYGSSYLGSNYHARRTAFTSDPASWSMDLPTAGEYEVFTRWTSGTNRSTEAPYLVYHQGGKSTISMNQQQRGGEWVSLGTFTFRAGPASRVALSCWTSKGDAVIADAVRFVKR